MAWKRQCGTEAVMPVQPVGQLLPPPPFPPSASPLSSSYADNTPPTWHSFYNWTSLGLDKVILCAFSDLFHQAGQAMFVGLLDLKAPDTREGTIDYQGWPSSFVPNVYLAQLSSFCIFVVTQLSLLSSCPSRLELSTEYEIPGVFALEWTPT